MGVELGTNSGFVEEAPTNDPTGSALGSDAWSTVTKDTSPATANTIIEVGWYCTGATGEANFEVGLYDDDSGVPDVLLESETTNAKGTDAGWKVVQGLNWSIDSSTPYWIGMQLDNTSTATNSDRAFSGQSGWDRKNSGGADAALPNPFDGGVLSDSDGAFAFYAVWEAAAPPATPFTSINIGDTWKSISGAAGVMKVNVGDSWKNVSAMKVNIGDAWKACTIS